MRWSTRASFPADRTQEGPLRQLQTFSGATDQAQDERATWPTVLVGGLVLGAIVSVAAALWRRLRIGEAIAPFLVRGPASPPEMTAAGTGAGTVALPAGTVDRPSPGEPATAVAGTAGSQPAKKGPSSKPAHTAPPPAAVPVPSPPPQSTRWREPTKYIVGVGLFLAILFVIFISRSVLPTIILAALLALIVYPLIRFIRRRLKLSKGLSVAITYLLVVLVLVLIPLIVVPVIISTINELLSIDFEALSQDVVQFLRDVSAQLAAYPVLDSLLSPLLDSLAAILEGSMPVETPEPVSTEEAMTGMVEQVGSTLGAIAEILGPVVSAVVSLLFMLLVSFYLSLSADAIARSYPRLFPPAIDQEIIALVNRVQDKWVRFIRGQVALMVFIGTMIFLGNAVLGNSYALLLGIISGLLELIPSIGPALALIPGVLLALIFGSSHFAIPNLTFALIVLAYYLLVQVFENQVVVPNLLGGAVDLPPVVVLMGVMVGGAVGGILGVLLATPIIATGLELFKYLYNKILEPPEAQGPPEKKTSILQAVRDRARRVKLPFGRRARQAATAGGQTE